MNIIIQILSSATEIIQKLEVLIPLICASVLSIIGAISGVIVKYRKTKKMDIGTIFKAVEKEKATFDKIKDMFKSDISKEVKGKEKNTEKGKGPDKPDERT